MELFLEEYSHEDLNFCYSLWAQKICLMLAVFIRSGLLVRTGSYHLLLVFAGLDEMQQVTLFWFPVLECC